MKESSLADRDLITQEVLLALNGVFEYALDIAFNEDAKGLKSSLDSSVVLSARKKSRAPPVDNHDTISHQHNLITPISEVNFDTTLKLVDILWYMSKVYDKEKETLESDDFKLAVKIVIEKVLFQFKNLNYNINDRIYEGLKELISKDMIEPAKFGKLMNDTGYALIAAVEESK